jgi:hypothetical protein
MKRVRMSAVGALAVPLALAAGMMTSGPAGASTTHARAADVTGVPAEVNTTSASCDPSEGPCEYNSGWVTYGDGGCELSTTVYFDPVTNSMDVWVWIQSPYLFASCTGYSTVYFGMASGPPDHSASFRAFACSTSDPTCPSFDYSYYGDQLTGIPTGSDYGVDSIWVSDAS